MKKTSQNESSQDKSGKILGLNKNFIEIFLAALPVLTAALYLLGLSYHTAYVDAFGLDYSLLPAATDRILLLGFIQAADLISFKIGISIFLVFVIPFFFLKIVGLPMFCRKEEIRSDNTTESPTDNTTESPTDNTTESPTKITRRQNKLEKAIKFIAFVIAVPLLLLVITYLSGKEGIYWAHKEMKAFQNKEGPYVTMYTKQLETNPIEAVQVSCGPSHCAFWLGEDKGAVVLRHEQIDKIVTHLPKEKVETPDVKPSDNKKALNQRLRRQAG